MTDRPPFRLFYHNHYLAEHQVPANVALHIAGTIGGLALMVAVGLGAILPWWALAFPIVHAAPGLLGHRLFERNETVGDVRVARTDFPPHWFIAANHFLLLDLLRGKRAS